MTKMLRRPTECSSTFTKSIQVSHCPNKNFLSWRRKKTTIPFIVIAVIVLSPALHFSQATDGTNIEHAHRHHHTPAQSHRVSRRNPKEKSLPELPLGLNKCNSNSYPEKFESFMQDLEQKQRNFDIEKFTVRADNKGRWEDDVNKMQLHLNATETSSVDLDDDDEDKDDEDIVLSLTRDDMIYEWQPPTNLLGGTQHHNRKFELLDKLFYCPETTYIQELHWHSFSKLKSKKGNSNILEFSNLSLLTNDGNLVWNKRNGERHEYNKSDYCIWKSGTEWVSFQVCTPMLSISNAEVQSTEIPIKVPKCCPKSELIEATWKKCISSNTRWRPKLYKSAENAETSTDDGDVPFSVDYEFGYPSCNIKYSMNEDSQNNFRLLLNGTLVQIEGDVRTYIHPGDFCIDGKYFNESEQSNGIFGNSELDQIVIACKPRTYRQQVKNVRNYIFAALNFISAIFLLLTATVYILIWRHQNNIHSWLQFSYSTSLFCTYTGFAIVQVWSEEVSQTYPSLCKAMGWLNHSTYLSAFFWLTSMNFDLWWRFSRPLRSTRVQTQSKKRKRFIGFAVFSIATPLMISCIGIILDLNYGGKLLYPPFITPPNVGKERCYFESKQTQIPYIYFPAGILLLVDFIFFASTVLHLRKMHTHTELARTQSTSTLEDRRGVRIIAKLFVVMGVLWLFELVSWICRLIFTGPEYWLTLVYIFTPLECLNCIQGVFIFFIFICKPNVRNQLSARFTREDAAKIWNKTQLPSVTTVQQPVIT